MNKAKWKPAAWKEMIARLSCAWGLYLNSVYTAESRALRKLKRNIKWLSIWQVKTSFNYLYFFYQRLHKNHSSVNFFLIFYQIFNGLLKALCSFFHRSISIFDKESYCSCRQAKHNKASLFALDSVAFLNLMMVSEIHLFMHNMKGVSSLL